MFEGIVGSRTFRDDMREMVVYHYAGNMHNAGMLMVFLPKERMLIEADSFTPANNPNEPPGQSRTSPTSSTRSIACGWTCSRSSRSHGRLTTLDEARAAAETFKRTQLFR